VHAPSEDKNDDVKDSFFEELGQVLDMKSLLGDCNAKVAAKIFSIRQSGT
jgi:hypothetical protein